MPRFIVSALSSALIASLAVAAPVQAASIGVAKPEVQSTGVVKAAFNCGVGGVWSHRLRHCVKV